MALPKIEIPISLTRTADFKRDLSSMASAVEKMEQRAVKAKEFSVKQADTLQAASNRRQQTEAEKSAAYMARVRERSALIAGRFYAKQVAEETRLEQQKTRMIEREVAKQARIRQKASDGLVKDITSKIGNAVGGATSMLATAASIGGGFAVGDALRYKLSAGSAATNAAIAAGGALSKDDFLNMSKSPSKRLGIDQTDIIKGMHAYIGKTGRGDMLNADAVNFMADVAKSQDISMETVGNVMGQMQVQNPRASMEEIKRLVYAAVYQGKQGSIEFNTMGESLAKATASKANYAGNSLDNMQKLAGFAQIAMGATGDPAEAATAVEHLSKSFSAKRQNWINTVEDPTGKGGLVKDPNELIKKAFQKTGGNALQLRALFDERGFKVIEPLIETFNAAEKDKKGSGVEAVMTRIKGAQAGNMSPEDLQKDLLEKMKDPVEQLNVVMNTLRQNIGEQVLPTFIKLVNKLPELIPYIEKLTEKFIELVDYFVDNPFKTVFVGLGIAVANAIVSSVVEAGIGALIEGTLATSLAVIAPEAIAVGLALAGLAYVLYGIADELDHQLGSEAKGRKDANTDIDEVKKLEANVAKGEAVEKAGGGDLVKKAAQEALEKKKAEIAEKAAKEEAKIKAEKEQAEKDNPPTLMSTTFGYDNIPADVRQKIKDDETKIKTYEEKMRAAGLLPQAAPGSGQPPVLNDTEAEDRALLAAEVQKKAAEQFSESVNTLANKNLNFSFSPGPISDPLNGR